SPLVAEGEGEALVGKEGRSLTLLRPVGKARFGETHYDVVSEGEFIGKDRPVMVIRVDGRRIVVREIKGES
ncbi:MAG: NfeD family protein, partial [Planctomycetota bacterium]